VDRYYDPATDQFLTVDPDLAETGQAYAFTGDDPLNKTDPLGLTAGPHRPSKSACSNSKNKKSCQKAIKKTESCGRLGCKDAKNIHKALPEAIALGLFVATGGVGDVVEALGEAGEAADGAADEGAADEAASCGGQSFTGNTRVRLADGRNMPISSVRAGDMVLAMNVETGQIQAERVSQLWLNRDSDLTDVTIKDLAGSSVLNTTQHHLFWDITDHSWVEADNLAIGDQLKSAEGMVSTVEKIRVLPGSAPMWDLTVNNDHDFFVSSGADGSVGVLVHNCPGESSWPTPTQSNCEQCAQDIQNQIGGNIVRVTPSEGSVLGPSANNPVGDWVFHDVVVNGGRVYDGFTGPDGLSPQEFMSQFEYAGGINFGGM